MLEKKIVSRTSYYASYLDNVKLMNHVIFVTESSSIFDLLKQKRKGYMIGILVLVQKNNLLTLICLL